MARNAALIASLPWYDQAASQRANDEFWQVLRGEMQSFGIEGVPTRLDRATPVSEQWRSQFLIVSQCCGLDLFAGKSLTPIGRPVFSDLNCEPGEYFSYIVSATEPLKYERVVINSPHSHSGCTALFNWMDSHGISPTEVLISGSHELSLSRIQSGAADLAAIDAHSWSRLSHEGIKILDQSPEAPSPPFVCTTDNSKVIFDCLENAIGQAGQLIGVTQIIPASIDTYKSMQQQIIPGTGYWAS